MPGRAVRSCRWTSCTDVSLRAILPVLVRDPQLADNAVVSGPAAGSPHVSWTMSGRTRCSVVSKLPSHFFSGVPNDPVCCVGCKTHQVSTELSNEIVDVLDLVFCGLFSKNSDPGYKAVSSAKLRRSWQRSFTVVLPKLEQRGCHLRNLQAWTCALCVTIRRSPGLHSLSTWRAVQSPSYPPWRRHGSFALLPETESMRFSPVLLSELGLTRIAAGSPVSRYELSALGVAEVPPAFPQQSPPLTMSMHKHLLRYHCELSSDWSISDVTVLVLLRDCVRTASVRQLCRHDALNCSHSESLMSVATAIWQMLSQIEMWLKQECKSVWLRVAWARRQMHLEKQPSTEKVQKNSARTNNTDIWMGQRECAVQKHQTSEDTLIQEYVEKLFLNCGGEQTTWLNRPYCRPN